MRRQHDGHRGPISRLSARDLVGEAAAGTLARSGRAALTCLGTVVGVGSFVATLGLTTTAEAQVSSRFDARAATEVIIEGPGSEVANAGTAFPVNSEDRLDRVNGVLGSGFLWEVDVGEAGVSARWNVQAGLGDRFPLLAATPGAFEVIGPTVSAGRVFDSFHAERAEPVAVLGEAAARRLGVTRLDTQQAIFVGDVPLTVIGVIHDVERHPEVLLSIVVPENTARRVWPSGPADTLVMIVQTSPGAAQHVAEQAPIALRPDAPGRFSVLAPPDPRRLRMQVSSDLTALFLALAGVSVVISAFGIANITLVAVLERVAEIGLRRALGARRRHIALQFLAESGVLGTVGGIVGTCVGVLVVVAVAAARTWTTVMEPLVVLPAPLLGTITGLLAGVYPSVKAASIEPIDALRT